MKEEKQKLTLYHLATYQIKVPGVLDERWSDWNGGMAVKVPSGSVGFQFVGNYLLSEEFCWRSILLPRMESIFGRWDWLANAVLFGVAHWGKPWHIPFGILSDILYAYPSRCFRRAWFGMILFVVDGLLSLFIMLDLVLELT